MHQHGTNVVYFTLEWGRNDNAMSDFEAAVKADPITLIQGYILPQCITRPSNLMPAAALASSAYSSTQTT